MELVLTLMQNNRILKQQIVRSEDTESIEKLYTKIETKLQRKRKYTRVIKAYHSS
jgi:hypothetical protein